jgi:hypothetical protein
MHFYKPDEHDLLWNRIVTAYDGPFSHCDVQFNHDQMASSIYMNEQVYFQKRKFSNKNYHPPIYLSVSQEGYNRAYQLCKKRFEEKSQFDMIDQVLTVLGVSLNRNNYTYCSRHCAEVLQAAGVPSLADVDVSSITPSSLHRILQKDRVIAPVGNTSALRLKM